jgi:IS30 family transposase
MGRRYGHLSHEDRGVIFAERRRGASLREIGGLLGRAASTIGRELGRGEGEDGGYSPKAARAVYGGSAGSVPAASQADRG